jgi:hypothetical protein
VSDAGQGVGLPFYASEQNRIVEIVEALVDQYTRKAS